MMATLAAGNRVRGGFMHWLKGAPTHVLAELLHELAEDGWVLRYVPPVCPKCGGRGSVTHYEDHEMGGTISNRTCPACKGSGCAPRTEAA